MLRLLFFLTVLVSCHPARCTELNVGVFDVDASPPIGSPLAYDSTKAVTTPLSCRGIVMTGAGDPIVMCAVDWIGIGNAGHTVFRERLAAAAETQADRVVVHALHQHDAPRCDFSADELLADYDLSGAGFDPAFSRDVIQRAAKAIKVTLQKS